VTSRRTVLKAGAGVTAAVTAAGCLEFGDDDPPPQPIEDDPDPHPATRVGPQTPTWETTGSPLAADLEATTIVDGLDRPWGMAIGPESVFITEQPGRIRRLEREQLSAETPTAATELSEEPVTFPELVTFADDERDEPGDGGLRGVALHPDYPDPAFVYCYYTAEGEQLINRVVRYDATTTEPSLEPVVDSIPGGEVKNGGQIRFGPTDALWITTGDGDDEIRAGNPNSLAGSVLRVDADGRPLETETLPEGGDPRLFSYGHRDVQGIGWLPDETPIVTEHGPAGHEEVSLLWPGANYGWPDVRGGPESEYDEYSDHPDIVPPVAASGPDTWTPRGGCWYDGDAISVLENRFLFGQSERLGVITLLGPEDETPEEATVYDADWLDDRYRAVGHELPVGEGYISHVTQGPGGAIYLLTSSEESTGNGRLIRLEEA